MSLDDMQNSATDGHRQCDRVSERPIIRPATESTNLAAAKANL